MPIQQTANVLNTFDLDMIPDSAPVIVYCDQGDHGDGRLVIHLVDDGVPYEPIPGALAVIQGTKPDGHSFIYAATIDGSTVIANLTEQMTACYGRTRVQVVVTEGNDRTGTYVFYLQVQKSALPQDPDLSRTDLQLIQQLIDEAESISVNVPYIGANGNWWIYSVSEGGYIDSGVDASITVDIADITMLAPDATPYVTNTGTNTDPIFHLFIPRGQTGAQGDDGVSPEVTITTITGGHRVTITDADHPSGQSFDVMDGAPGGMQASTYDPQGEVAAAGGIPAYVEAQTGGGTVSEDLLRDTVGWTGKNLLQIPASVVSQNINGVDFMVYRDAAGEVTSIKANGTASAACDLSLFNQNTPGMRELLQGKSITLSGGVSDSAYLQFWNIDGSGTTKSSKTTETTFTFSNQSANFDLSVHIQSGASVSNVVLYPMIRQASVADDTYEPYHESVEDYMLPQSVQNVMGAKNLLAYPYYEGSKTQNGVTFTVNADGSITVSINGAATADTWFNLAQNPAFMAPGDSYTVSGCPSGGSSGTYCLRYTNNTDQAYEDTGSGVDVEGFASSYTNVQLYIRVKSGTTISTPVTFYPMVRLAEYTDPTYEPYAMTNKQLTDGRDEWTGTVTVDANSQATFTGLNDDYGYAAYVWDKLASVLGVTKTGSGTSVTAVYTLDGVSQGDSCRLRVIK